MGLLRALLARRADLGSPVGGNPPRPVHQRGLPLLHVRPLPDLRARGPRDPRLPLDAAVDNHLGEPPEGHEGGPRRPQDRAGLLRAHGRQVSDHGRPQEP
eukprot:9421550-Heterocapsa_arctica.AAC.1